MNLIYNILLTFCVPFILVRLWWRGRKLPGYRQRIRERFGLYTCQPCAESIWLHAVSFGEMVAADQLIEHLIKTHRNTQILITNMTITGSERAHARFAGGQYPNVTQVYIPWDLPFAIQRFLRHFKPKFGIIMETELWPNLLKSCHQQNIPINLINARLSKRSTRGYALIKPFTKKMLQYLNHIGAQSRTDARRFAFLGADTNKLSVLGNLKFDLNPPEPQIIAGKNNKSTRPTFIAASTHEGEETLVLDALQAVKTNYPTALLILVPRHPERFETVAQLCIDRGFSIARHSLGQKPTPQTDILLGDSMGEMFYFYALSDIAVVGGSFAPIGGHNILEPIALDLPVITGPNLFHLAEIQSRFPVGHSRIEVTTTGQLADALIQLFADQDSKTKIITKAKKIYEQNQGALQRYCELLNC